MSFLAPAFLLALAALAVPVLIHLIERERKQVVEFPSLMFLRRIPYQSVRRRRIRHWLLLMMRLAALALIVAAFARPFLRRPGLAASAAGGPREVVILLDRSYSMGYGDRWERARAAARDAVRALGPEDRATLVLFASGAEVDVRSSADRARLLSVIDAAGLGAGATRYGPALKVAQSILAESQLARREVILVSDLQKVGWDRSEGLRLPEGASLTPVSVAGGETLNVTLSAVSLQRAPFSGQERITVTAGLLNRGDRRVDDLEVTLEIDGRPMQSQRIRLEANGTGAVSFAPFTLSSAHTRGTVRAAGDALPADNAFHFVVSPGRPVPVLLVERGSAARDASLYLTRALSIGEAPAFEVEVRSIERATPADVDDRAVVILNDVPLASSALASRLSRFVESGGGVFMILGERGGWSSQAAGFLPGAPGATIDRPTGRGGALGAIDYSHAVFELFKAPRSGDFSAARFYRYRALNVGASDTVLARFDDGAAAMAERKVGQGRALVWTSTLDTFWNDLALKPVFLPFVHQTVSYLARYTGPTPWFTVGQVVDPAMVQALEGSAARQPAPRATDRVALTPSGKPVALDATRKGLLELDEQGFYEIRARGADEPRPLALAANLDVAESDLTAIDPKELVAAVAGRAGTAARAGPPVELSAEDQERRQGGWWYLLLAGIFLLALETALANRLSRAGPVGD